MACALSRVTDRCPQVTGARGSRRTRSSRHMVGQEQRVHTGWLEVDGNEAAYAPHTKAGHALPPSGTLFAVGAGIGMRPGYKQARRLGLADPA